MTSVPAAEPTFEQAELEGGHAARHLLWQAVLELLEADPEISRASFSTWLRGTQLLAWDGSGATVSAQHSFARDKLEHAYRSAIEQALAHCSGKQQVHVRFVVGQREPARTSHAPLTTVVEADTHPANGRPPREPTGPRFIRPAMAALENALAPADGTAPAPSRGAVDRALAVTKAQSTQGGALRNASLGLTPLVPPPPPVMSAAAHGLSPRRTFATFVVGKSNQFAFAAARAVADNPSMAYNPLFLFGGPGLGKTHLLQAIAQQATQTGVRARYTTAHAFLLELAERRKEGSLAALESDYRSLDALLIDDVQLLGAQPVADGQEPAGPEIALAQEELLSIFNMLCDANKQVVLAADRPPRALTGMDERLRSRFQMGLVADVGPLEEEARAAIVWQRSVQLRQALEPEVCALIARRVAGNARELEGALTRVLAAAELSQLPLTVETASAALSGLNGSAGFGAQARTQPERVLQAVAEVFGVLPAALQSKRRDKEIVLARHVAMYVMREVTGISLADIGHRLGGRDHSTILHGCDKIAGLLERDGTTRAQVEMVRHVLTLGALESASHPLDSRSAAAP